MSVFKFSCLLLFIYSCFLGITCPRAGRIVTPQGIIATDGEPCGDEALSFTKDLCMQREVIKLPWKEVLNETD